PVPLDSEFYVVRPADEAFRAAIARQDSIVVIQGPRQIGKTSLLARGLQQARQAGARVILTDFQLLNAAQLESAETFLLTLARWIADELELDREIDDVWNLHGRASVNFQRYLQREVLSKTPEPIVWGMDE